MIHFDNKWTMDQIVKPSWHMLFIALGLPGCHRKPPSPETTEPVTATAGGNETVTNDRDQAMGGATTSAPMRLFTHFIGESCALSVEGETWCPSYASSFMTYSRLDAPEPLVRVTRDPSGLNYLLGKSGQVYVFGTTDPDSEGDGVPSYPKPTPVPELANITAMTAANRYLALTRDGTLLGWSISKIRDSEGEVTGFTISQVVQALPQKVSRIQGSWGACLQEESGGFFCTMDTDLTNGHLRSLPELQQAVPSLGFVGTSACFLTTEVHCFAGWTPLGLGNVTLAGHFTLPIQPAKLAHELVLDRDGHLFRFTNPRLPHEPPYNVEAPTLRPVAAVGRIRDFEGRLCTISQQGVLGCREDKLWAEAPSVPVIFSPLP